MNTIIWRGLKEIFLIGLQLNFLGIEFTYFIFQVLESKKWTYKWNRCNELKTAVACSAAYQKI